MKLCSIEGCDRPARSRGWCSMHYHRWWKHGDVGPAERIDLHVTKHGTHNEYHNYGCRCEPCKKAASEYQRQYQAAPCEGCGKTIYGRFRKGLCRECRTAERTTPLEELHGTTTGYKRGCRCVECRAASAAARRRYRKEHPEVERAYTRKRYWQSRTPLQIATRNVQ